jgi:Repeat of unknown function (DUF5648)
VTEPQTLVKRTCGDRADAVPLFRVYDANAGDHFYTTSVAQRNNAITNLAYSDEGIAGYVFPTQELHTVPLYRLWSRRATDHFYTISTAQRDSAVANKGYVDEGIAAYVYPDTECGGDPFYRSYNPELLDHFYTVREAEWDRSSTIGWNKEGIAAYIFAT